jgi:rod shape-determining protein MreD
MTATPTNIARLALFGVLACLAQIVIAPNIRIVTAVPDLVLITVIIQAIRLPQTPATVFGFVLGLLFDLTSSGPFGLMTLILTLLALLVSSLNKGTFTEHWIVEMLLMALAALFGELLYGVISVLINPDLDFIGSLLAIVLPTTLYDAVIGAVILLIIHLLGGRDSGGYGSLGGGRSSGGLGGGRLGGHGGPSSLGGSRLGGSARGRPNRPLDGHGGHGGRAGRLGRPSGKLPGGKLLGKGSKGSKIPGRPINRKLH